MFPRGRGLRDEAPSPSPSGRAEGALWRGPARAHRRLETRLLSFEEMKATWGVCRSSQRNP